MDSINMNNACTNNNFSLLKINKLVDSITGFEFLSSLDINLGYHQIHIYLEDNEKTYFIIKG